MLHLKQSNALPRAFWEWKQKLGCPSCSRGGVRWEDLPITAREVIKRLWLILVSSLVLQIFTHQCDYCLLQACVIHGRLGMGLFPVWSLLCRLWSSSLKLEKLLAATKRRKRKRHRKCSINRKTKQHVCVVNKEGQRYILGWPVFAHHHLDDGFGNYWISISVNMRTLVSDYVLFINVLY